jgi:hypothetical protein
VGVSRTEVCVRHMCVCMSLLLFDQHVSVAVCRREITSE